MNSSGICSHGPSLIKLGHIRRFFHATGLPLFAERRLWCARRVDFIDDKRLVAYDASFTTCQRGEGPSWMPAWIVNATSIKFDKEADVGEASGGVLRFMSVPILAAPTFTFPLSDKRKSGLLPPTIGIDSVNGTSATIPYYFDIAPQRDATFAPTFMSKRGVDLAGEFRYLERNYRGEFGKCLPNDSCATERWCYTTCPAEPSTQAAVGWGWVLI